MNMWMENLKHKNENSQRKYLNNMEKNPFLKVMNCILEFEKYFMESRNRELKDSEVKIKREIEELFLEPIIVSKDNILFIYFQFIYR